MKTGKIRFGTIISIDQIGQDSAGVILNKRKTRTCCFFFDNTTENFKTGDKIRYKLRRNGVAYKVKKVKNSS